MAEYKGISKLGLLVGMPPSPVLVNDAVLPPPPPLPFDAVPPPPPANDVVPPPPPLPISHVAEEGEEGELPGESRFDKMTKTLTIDCTKIGLVIGKQLLRPD